MKIKVDTKMWKQQSNLLKKFTELSENLHLETTTGDSGFISSDYICSSEFSSSSLSGDIQSSFVDSHKAMDSSCTDSVLSECFDQLSLKHTHLNQPVSSKKISESKIKSECINGDSVIAYFEKVESYQATWRFYFTQNDDGDTLLHAAVIHGYFKAFVTIIKDIPDPCLLDILNDDCQTALHLAVITNQPKFVRRLVLAGADLSVRNAQGNTALHLACNFGNMDCAQALTKPVEMEEQDLLRSNRKPTIPQNLEQQNYLGETCLHIAASRNHVALVDLLLQRGADLEARDSLAGRTILLLALERRCRGVVHYLLEKCQPNLQATTYSGCTAYQIVSCFANPTLPATEEFRQAVVASGFLGTTAASA